MVVQGAEIIVVSTMLPSLNLKPFFSRFLFTSLNKTAPCQDRAATGNQLVHAFQRDLATGLALLGLVLGFRESDLIHGRNESATALLSLISRLIQSLPRQNDTGFGPCVWPAKSGDRSQQCLAATTARSAASCEGTAFEATSRDDQRQANTRSKTAFKRHKHVQWLTAWVAERLKVR